MCRRQYGLDPAHYYTSPGLPCDALLKKTGVELELLTDYDQPLFIEKGIRGGVSMVSKRHAKANNHLVDGYNPENPISYILYLDANNLYAWAMSQPYLFIFSLSLWETARYKLKYCLKGPLSPKQPTNQLPTGAFQWEEDCEQLTKIITDHPADDPEGFTLEVTWSTQKTTQRAQCISAVTRAHGGSEEMDVRVSARRQRLRSWSQTSVTRTAMCFTIAICSYTRLWACV